MKPSLQQPTDCLLHKSGTLVVSNAFPRCHIQGCHPVAHRDNFAASFYFFEDAERICIGYVADCEWCAALYCTRAVIRDRILILCDFAGSRVSTSRLIGTVG